jgi:hypothetical protein
MSHLPWNFSLWVSVVDELIPSHVKAREIANDPTSFVAHGKLLALLPIHADNSANMGFRATGTTERLFALERVLDAADSVLDLSNRLVGVALGFQLGIAKHLAGNLLDFAFDLSRRTVYPVLVHDLFSIK